MSSSQCVLTGRHCWSSVTKRNSCSCSWHSDRKPPRPRLLLLLLMFWLIGRCVVQRLVDAHEDCSSCQWIDMSTCGSTRRRRCVVACHSAVRDMLAKHCTHTHGLTSAGVYTPPSPTQHNTNYAHTQRAHRCRPAHRSVTNSHYSIRANKPVKQVKLKYILIF